MNVPVVEDLESGSQDVVVSHHGYENQSCMSIMFVVVQQCVCDDHVTTSLGGWYRQQQRLYCIHT